MNRLLIAGSRSYETWSPTRMDQIFDNASYIFDVPFVDIIEGCAAGADRHAERWAESKDYDVRHMPADWGRLGKSAGYLRNVEMVKLATHVIVVWDGTSKGAKHTIDIARDSQRPLVVVTPN